MDLATWAVWIWQFCSKWWVYHSYTVFHSQFNIGQRGAVPSRNTILRWVENFRSTGNIMKKKPLGPRHSVTTPENVGRVREPLIMSPRLLARRHASACITCFKHSSGLNWEDDELPWNVSGFSKMALWHTPQTIQWMFFDACFEDTSFHVVATFCALQDLPTCQCVTFSCGGVPQKLCVR